MLITMVHCETPSGTHLHTFFLLSARVFVCYPYYREVEYPGEVIGLTITGYILFVSLHPGVTNPVEPIGQIAREVDALFYVDFVSSAFGEPLFVDKWNIDLGLLGTQKVLRRHI